MKTTTIIALAALAVGAAPVAHAQAAKAKAIITPDAAKATALAQVKGGAVKSSELEREGGKLLYSFDIATKGKPGIDEVHVDAITGKVLSNTHETPSMEKAEAKADAKEKKAEKKAGKKSATP